MKKIILKDPELGNLNISATQSKTVKKRRKSKIKAILTRMRKFRGF